MNDTAPAIEKRMLEMLAVRTPAERLKMASSMFDSARTLMQIGLRRDYPTYTPSQLRVLMFQRLYGDCFDQMESEHILQSLADMQNTSLHASLSTL